jgi:hypothetical protein
MTVSSSIDDGIVVCNESDAPPVRTDGRGEPKRW